MIRSGGTNHSSNSGSSSNSSNSSFVEQQIAAAQRAREEAERRAAIQAQIDARNGQIGQLNGILSQLQAERTDMTNSIQKWVKAKEVFGQENITYAGKGKNIFEGDAVTSVKQQNDAKITSMDGKMSSAISIKDSVSTQENRVTARISTLGTEIANLRSQL